MLMQILGGSESDLLHWDLVHPGLAEQRLGKPRHARRIR